MTKTFISLFVFSLLFLGISCSDEATITQTEAIRAEALNSAEFKALKDAWNNYNDLKVEKGLALKGAIKSSSVEKQNIEIAKVNYFESLGNEMEIVMQKANAFRAKYPQLADVFTQEELFDQLNKSLK